MADEARESIHIQASPEQCYAVAIDFDRYPEWATDVKHVEVLELDGSYSFEAQDGGTQVGYVLAVDITIPLPGFMKKAAAGMIVQNAMKQLKEYVEAGGGG